ncbi:hypothetical protein Thermus77412_24060 [Thermus antranikianii]
MRRITTRLLREIHWALVPVFIPLGSVVIRWTLGLTLVALAYYTWVGNPGLSELPGIAIFAYTAFLTGHLYETLEIRTPFEGTRLEPLFTYAGKTTSYTRFRWGIFFGLPWAVGLGIGYHGLLAGYPTASALGFALALAGYLGVRQVILKGVDLVRGDPG